MVNGKLKCLGSSQFLKTTYGSGYEMEIKTLDQKSAVERIKSLVDMLVEEQRRTSREAVPSLSSHSGSTDRKDDLLIAKGSSDEKDKSLDSRSLDLTVHVESRPAKPAVQSVAKESKSPNASAESLSNNASAQVSSHSAKLLEDFGGRLRFALPAGLRLSRLFKRLEAARLEYSIEDYQISQATLEQVFISFAKHQIDTDRPPN
jgi:hypothetical protein